MLKLPPRKIIISRFGPAKIPSKPMGSNGCPQHPGQVIVAQAQWDEKAEDIVINKSAETLKVLK